MRNAAGGATQGNGNIEVDLAEAIRSKKLVGTSQVFAENGTGRAFVVAGRRIQAAIRHIMEFLIMGVAQITIEVPSAYQWAGIQEPRRLGAGPGEEVLSCRSEFPVGRTPSPMRKFAI